MTGRAPSPRPPNPRPDLATETSPGVGEGEALLLVPVGSVEQHGPHLPLATDTVVATTVARAAAAALVAEGRRVLVAPAVSYGNSGEHEGFPGTVSIGHEALHAVLVELGRSACRWAQGVIFVNGHGGNVATLRGAVSLLRYEGRPVAWTVCDVPDGDAHAGRTETSLALELMPGAVRGPLAEPGCTLPLAQLLPRLRRDGVRAVSANGVLGDPTGASAEEGRALHVALVRTLVHELRALDVLDDGRLARPVEVPA
ncbi:mycofactocin biosynthesis peptidyl-dipeptidase MftE [Lapillicoccus jejuensis]|uniref:Creatinine amidohydrolase n=1 Tax=Lapillicoccus jejuensis TaxID=402171 RepID=A0A542E3E1_9MICO|nr:mycofactocin biosynthesis peptidyl-dipeptidase MftE [Lapillicoccus jejuensis]TQJ09858.1 creatinine amidohydrolase [Lapillicoccus jejuensis]